MPAGRSVTVDRRRRTAAPDPPVAGLDPEPGPEIQTRDHGLTAEVAGHASPGRHEVGSGLSRRGWNRVRGRQFRPVVVRDSWPRRCSGGGPGSPPRGSHPPGLHHPQSGPHPARAPRPESCAPARASAGRVPRPLVGQELEIRPTGLAGSGPHRHGRRRDRHLGRSGAARGQPPGRCQRAAGDGRIDVVVFQTALEASSSCLGGLELARVQHEGEDRGLIGMARIDDDALGDRDLVVVVSVVRSTSRDDLRLGRLADAIGDEEDPAQLRVVQQGADAPGKTRCPDRPAAPCRGRGELARDRGTAGAGRPSCLTWRDLDRLVVVASWT